MPFLMGLANEILTQVIHETSAGDIASLASCCKHLHILAQERLAFHKKQRAEAGKIIVGWGDVHASAIHPLKNLQEILENDDVRFYTRVMKIGYLSSEDPDDHWIRNAEISREKQREALIANIGSRYSYQISALVAKVYETLSPYASKTDLKKWTDKVICGEKAAIVILLLALYPYLESLRIYETDQDWVTEEMSLKERESIPLAQRMNDAWGNLFRSLTATAIVPVTNKLGIFINGSCIRGRNIPWSYGTGTSEVTDLDLQGDLDRTSLMNLIRGLKKLESFRYMLYPHQGNFVGRARDDPNRLKWGPRANNDAADADSDEDSPDKSDEDIEDPSGDNSGEDDVDRPLASWEPRAITGFLMQYTRDSLVSLTLEAISFRGVEKLSHHEPFIGSLRSFGALKNVSLDTMMLFKRVKCTRNVPVVGGSSIQQVSWEEIRAQRLVDFLPVTIESFTMTCGYVGKGLSKRDVGWMFTGLPKLKNRLPELTEIIVVKMDPEDDPRLMNMNEEEEGFDELCLRCDECEIETRERGL